MKNTKYLISLLLSLIMALSVFTAVPFCVSAAEKNTADNGAGVSVDNEQMNAVLLSGTEFYATDHGYDGSVSHIVDSYLVQNSDSTLTRIEHYYEDQDHYYNLPIGDSDYYDPQSGEGQKILVDTYSSDGKTLISKRYIQTELERFGGFFSGSKYNFFVFCKNNTAKSDNAEVFRVVKYSKDWKRLAAVSLKGVDTKFPINGGSLRMTESGGKLYIHTCRIQYSGHEANLTFTVDEEKNTVTETSAQAGGSGGYVSHSFNQFIQAADGYVYRVDHGDSYPTRAVSIKRSSVSKSITDISSIDVIDLSKTGRNGYNFTGTQLGGFEVVSSGCVLAGSIVNYETYDKNPDRTENIFICVTDKNLKSTKVKMLTKYTKSSGWTASNPHLVKINNNKLLILWEEIKGSNDDTDFFSERLKRTKFATIDASGNLTSSVYSNGFDVSDCKPVLCKDGLIRWYAGTAGNKLTYTDEHSFLYTLDPANLAASNGIKSFYGTADESGFTGDCIWALYGTELFVLGDGEMADYDNPWGTDITKVTFKNGVKKIGMSVFDGCAKLKSVTLSDSVSTIDDFAFYSCTSLKSVTIPKSVKTIGYSAFGYYIDLGSGGSPWDFDTSWDFGSIKRIKDFTIYGYRGSEAQSYAEENNFTFIPIANTATVSGKVTSYLSDTDPISVLLMQGGKVKKNANLRGNSAKFSFADVNEGTYTVLVSKVNHVNREYTVNVADKDVTLNAVVNPKGDVTGDGKTNVQDCTAILRYVRKLDTELSDYQLSCADVTGDGKVNVQDVTRILRHVRKIEELY